MAKAGIEDGNASPPGKTARMFDGLVSVFNAGGSAWIFGIMILLSADVLSRSLLNAPITGVPLLVELSILVIVFLQLPAAIRSGRLTRSDILLAGLIERRPSLGITLRAAYDALGIFLMAVIFYYTVPTFVNVWNRGTFEGLEGQFALPSWPFKLLILVGALFCAIQFARSLAGGFGDLVGLRRNKSFETGSVVKLAVIVVAMTALFYALISYSDISDAGIGLISIVFVLFFVYVGVHVGVALALISFVCVWGVRGSLDNAGTLLALSVGESMQEYEFGVIPLFVLMGLLVSVSGIGRDTYDVANHIFRRVRAGLGPPPSAPMPYLPR